MFTRSWLMACCLTLLAACGQSADQEADQPEQPVSSASPTQQMTNEPMEDTPDGGTDRSPRPESRPRMDVGTRLVVADSNFGPVLFDAAGQAIYLFDVETSPRPRCYRACAKAWPPVLTQGRPVAGRGARKALLGTTQRTDGTTQVTYDGHPLYFYAHEARHQVKCHDVFMNGGNWYAIASDGNPAPT
jgi:predicted lipoprotein with Yx(FWY)xxD motif